MSYCCYCGYKLIVGNITSTQSSSQEINIGGTMAIQPVNVSINPLKKMKKRDITFTHPGDKCIKCLNFVLIDPHTNYIPQEVVIDTSTIIIVPYTLRLHIKNLENVYEEKFDDLKNWLENKKDKFTELLRCYINNGSINPCEKKAVGYELTLQFIKSENIIDLHIIIDDSGAMDSKPKYEYRLVFRGGKVDCQK